MAHQAQETFVAELESGPQLVQRGAVFADAHPLVALDAGRGVLFKPLDIDGEDEAPVKPKRARPGRRAAGGGQVPDDGTAEDGDGGAGDDA